MPAGHPLLINVCLALAYCVAGWLASLLSSGPTTGSPLYPPAGIALAAVLIYGNRVLPGIVIGGFLVAMMPTLIDAFTLPRLLATLAIAFGAALQAWVGSRLIRWRPGFPDPLEAPGAVWQAYLLGGPLASVVNPSVAMAAMYGAGLMPAADLTIGWWTWWSGDTLGVLIMLPIALVLLARPRADWSRRMPTVLTPTAIACLLASLSLVQIERWQNSEIYDAFAREAYVAQAATAEAVKLPLYALEAMHGLAREAPALTDEQFQRFTVPWLSLMPGLYAVGMSDRVPGASRETFERAMRDRYGPDFRIRDRSRDGELHVAPPADEYFVITRLEPEARNRMAIGVNQFATPESRAALKLALTTGSVVATAGFRLAQERDHQTGVVAYRVIDRGASLPPNAGSYDRPGGSVFVSLRMDDTLGSIDPALLRQISLCLVDVTDTARQVRLAGPPDCERTIAPSSQLQRFHRLDFAGRQWNIVATAMPDFVTTRRTWVTPALGLVPLLATGMLGAFLLVVSGRTRRIEVQVAQRTEALQIEIASRLDALRARESAESANRAKNSFLSRMSHELRTPLNALLGFAQLMKRDRNDPLSDTQRQRVEHLEQAGWHLLDMVNDVLDLSRIESGTLRVTRAPLNLEAVVASCADLVRPQFESRAINLTVSIDRDAHWLMGDETRIKQVLLNLLSNAAKFNDPGGDASLQVQRQSSDRIRLTVRDHGWGMTPQQQERLFEPFNRLGRDGQVDGTGIGLVISRHLIELMGGSLTVHSQPGEGSSFVVTLPADEDHHPQQQPEHAASASASASASVISSAAAAAPGTGTGADAGATSGDTPAVTRIVYVEDNRLNAILTRDLLLSRPHTCVDLFESGQQALENIAQLNADLVLLDLNLPDISGLQVLAGLRADPRTSALPVIIVSADATPERIAAVMAAGANDYLTKPFQLRTMLAIIDQALQRGHAALPGQQAD